MDKLTDETLLRIFSFIHFTEQIVLRTVSCRQNSLLYDYSFLEDISITRSHCEDQQLSSLFATAKRLIAMDFFNSHFLGWLMFTSRRTKWAQAPHFVRDQYHQRNFVKHSSNYQRSRRTSLNWNVNQRVVYTRDNCPEETKVYWFPP